MAVNIYLGQENLPKDKKFVFDVESAIYLVNVEGTAFQRKVLMEIEQGSYGDSRRWVDRFGSTLYYSDMSTGAKILFELDALDMVINCVEIGNNALGLIQYIEDCHVYLDSNDIIVPYNLCDIKIKVNGISFDNNDLACDYIKAYKF